MAELPVPPLRLLIVCPSWVGDAVMVTPALRMIRSGLTGCFIGGLVRPGIDQVLAGTDFFDEVHVERASGVMGPKFVAAKVRPRRYDAALLFTNSFSTALTTRIAGIPRRIGYNRDGRGLLLTHKLDAAKRPDGEWAIIPAVLYYLNATRFFLGTLGGPKHVDLQQQPPLRVIPDGIRMELGCTPAEHGAAEAVLSKTTLAAGAPFVILNPGGNNEAKRWPADRFGAIARHLQTRHGLHCLVNGSPNETDLVQSICAASPTSTSSLPAAGISLGALKALCASGLCRMMITNDTGPRHIAAAFGVPVISLFGPTDHRWTTIPTAAAAGGPGGERLILADPTLPESEVSNDHPDRCRIDRIELQTVIDSADELLSTSRGPVS